MTKHPSLAKRLEFIILVVAAFVGVKYKEPLKINLVLPN